MSPAQRAVTAANLGAWVFKAAPGVWDLDAYLAAGRKDFDSWSVVDNYRTDMMAPSQRAFIWAGMGYRDIPSGVVGSGLIVGSAHNAKADEHWVDPSETRTRHLFAQVDIKLLARPVLREEFLTDPILRTAEIIRQPQMSNPTFLTKDEVAALDRLLKGG